MENLLRKIRDAARDGRVTWRYHALVRARRRGIQRHDALRALVEGDLVEEDPTASPFPRFLFAGAAPNGRIFYVAASYDANSDRVFVVTVHWLDPRRWEDPWTRRA